MSYRVWFDQRRGWRYTNPNLEQLELVEVDYLGLDRADRDYLGLIIEKFDGGPVGVGTISGSRPASSL